MIMVVNGPNINLLEERDRELYGGISAGEIKNELEARAAEDYFDIEWKQSNSEGMLVDFLQKNRHNAQGIIINPAAYSHTSIALLDCFKMLDIPIIEVHLSNPAARGDDREFLTAAAADGVIMGFGAESYLLAYQELKRIISSGGEQ